MSLRRHATRRDAVEPEVIDALLAHGFSVKQLSAKDIPDLLIGKHGQTRIAEVKTGTKKLSEGQDRFWRDWRGNGKIVLRSVEDVGRLARLWSLPGDLADAA
jgi:hypothetical protein